MAELMADQRYLFRLVERLSEEFCAQTSYVEPDTGHTCVDSTIGQHARIRRVYQLHRRVQPAVPAHFLYPSYERRISWVIMLVYRSALQLGTGESFLRLLQPGVLFKPPSLGRR